MTFFFFFFWYGRGAFLEECDSLKCPILIGDLISPTKQPLSCQGYHNLYLPTLCSMDEMNTDVHLHPRVQLFELHSLYGTLKKMLKFLHLKPMDPVVNMFPTYFSPTCSTQGQADQKHVNLLYLALDLHQSIFFLLAVILMECVFPQIQQT